MTWNLGYELSRFGVYDPAETTVEREQSYSPLNDQEAKAEMRRF